MSLSTQPKESNMTITATIVQFGNPDMCELQFTTRVVSEEGFSNWITEVKSKTDKRHQKALGSIVGVKEISGKNEVFRIEKLEGFNWNEVFPTVFETIKRRFHVNPEVVYLRDLRKRYDNSYDDDGVGKPRNTVFEPLDFGIPTIAK